MKLDKPKKFNGKHKRTMEAKKSNAEKGKTLKGNGNKKTNMAKN